MARERKTAIMARYGRKEPALARYGTMKNVYRAMAPQISHVVSSPQQLSDILDNKPCTPAQASAVDKAVEYLLDRPHRILDRLMEQAAPEQLPDLLCLREALAVPDEVLRGDEAAA